MDFSEYKNWDAWSDADLQALCCGKEPDKSRPLDAELNEAIDAIRRAVLVGALPAISIDDATAGDRSFYRARYFLPSDAIPWAAKRFPNKFPFTADSVPQSKSNNGGEKPLQTTERNTLITIIAALCKKSAIDYQEPGAAAKIEKLTQIIGAKVTDDTVRKVLKKIPDVLEARME